MYIQTTTSHATRARYENATTLLQAWAITNGEKNVVGRLVVKGKATGQGHTFRAWLHIFGRPMVEGKASGGGYDMVSDAVADAFAKAWPSLEIHERARLAPAAQGLESRMLDDCLRDAAGFVFVRAI